MSGKGSVFEGGRTGARALLILCLIVAMGVAGFGGWCLTYGGAWSVMGVLFMGWGSYIGWTFGGLARFMWTGRP